MKKQLLSLLFVITAPLCAKTWPAALSIPLMVPALLNDQNLIETVADNLDFNHSRGIEFRINIPGGAPAHDSFNSEEEANPPVSLDYRLRWGYKGAGSPSEPFKGVRGSVHVHLSYDGLTFHLSKSKSLRKKLNRILASVLTVKPCEEFYLKLAQLVWTIANDGTPDVARTTSALKTLFSRLKLTPGGSECKLYGMPLLSAPGTPGLEEMLSRAPEQFTQKFIVISSKLGTVLSLLTGTTHNPEKAAYLKSLVSQVDYYQEKPFVLNLPRGGSVTLAFDHIGSGDADEGFSGTIMSIELPQTRTAGATLQPVSWNFVLKSEHECIARMALLLMHHRHSPLPAYKLAEEISTLLARMGVTPNADGSEPSQARALLGLACQYHQQIIHSDFSKPLTRLMGTPELLLQLARIAYRAYTMSADKEHNAQEVADFATLHAADALRCYRGIAGLRGMVAEQTRVPCLEKKGVTLDLGLFVKTLLAPPPGRKSRSKTRTRKVEAPTVKAPEKEEAQ